MLPKTFFCAPTAIMDILHHRCVKEIMGRAPMIIKDHHFPSS